MHISDRAGRAAIPTTMGIRISADVQTLGDIRISAAARILEGMATLRRAPEQAMV
jgi:hypothetical protein